MDSSRFKRIIAAPCRCSKQTLTSVACARSVRTPSLRLAPAAGGLTMPWPVMPPMSTEALRNL